MIRTIRQGQDWAVEKPIGGKAANETRAGTRTNKAATEATGVYAAPALVVVPDQACAEGHPTTSHPFSDDLSSNGMPAEAPPVPVEDLSRELSRIQRRVNQLISEQVELIIVAEEQRVARSEAFTSDTAHVKAVLGISGGQARKLLRLRALQWMPQTCQAFAQGWLSVDQAIELVRAVELNEDEFANDEPELLALILDTNLASDARAIIDEWMTRVAPQELEDIKAVHHQARGVFVTQLESGMKRLTWYERADVIARAQQRLEATAPSVGDGRTHAQILSDTMVDLLMGAKGRQTNMVIHVDETVLRYNVGGLAEDRNGNPISIEEARRLACDTWAGRLIHGPGQVTLEMGRTRRLLTPHQRRSLESRDKRCRFPDCDRPTRWCDAHHIQHWVDNGLTDLDNLILVCRHHHRLVHEGGYQIQGTPEKFKVFAPDGRFYGTSTIKPRPGWSWNHLEAHRYRHERPANNEDKYRYIYQARQWARRGIGQRPTPLDLTPQPEEP